MVYRLYRFFIFIRRGVNYIVPYKDLDMGQKFHHRIFFTILIVIGGVLVYANIYGQQVPPEEYSKGSVLYRVYAEPNLFIETTTSSVYTKDVSYLGETGGRRVMPYGASGVGEETTLPTAHDDTALVKINVPTGANIVVRDRIMTHVVQEGDMVSNIARLYGLSVNTIIWNNDIGSSGVIRPGQQLKILPYDGVLYAVKKNDTLAKIASTYQSSVDSIIEKNKLADASDVQIGENIIIPNGIKPVVLVRRSVSTGREVIENIFYPTPSDGGTKLLWPTAARRITQYFGFRHTGLDIADKKGTPIYAAEAGKVERVLYQRTGYGYHIIINHGGDLRTLYGHASKIFVQEGQTVARGDVIALMGSTGRSTGPHLHFEVRVKGKRVNPLGYIK